ncbi:hypothetical protein BC477_19505 [Clavibacter michiganensis subsp. michiganensis]|uniref:Uncharacterized protein n=1 Tax=Clavibacter michiganensis subsp. michiganensis TaxID=33013 RepID=A0A251XGW5_CLAMM|nr:hypothetical protein BC477_19505 [Clavibacter michiganensis subsp. michiganensis]OUE01671.1 hypothetical protein CMMCAS07_15290 [Clavibacter michiganensis subsp. michiganensis]
MHEGDEQHHLGERDEGGAREHAPITRPVAAEDASRRRAAGRSTRKVANAPSQRPIGTKIAAIASPGLPISFSRSTVRPTGSATTPDAWDAWSASSDGICSAPCVSPVPSSVAPDASPSAPVARSPAPVAAAVVPVRSWPRPSLS